ncbi:MAG: 5'/3'-nucleotidase SurE [Clostridiales bacterium]|nr:5'/3'-nucleotidase SurE [Clostridiales bacterium]
MHLLLTNDDGITARGLQVLAQTAMGRGHQVTLVAPSTQQSATSHRLTLNDSLLAREFPMEGVRAFAVNGSPVDCVRVGRYLAGDSVDFCLSGINDGLNLGTAIYYSGTAAAAREAAMLNLPAMAISIGLLADDEMLVNLSNIALDMMDKLLLRPLPRLTFANLNAPTLPPDQLKGLRVCPMSDSFFLDRYVQRVNPRGVSYFWIEAGEEMEPSRPDTDVALVNEGYVTCTFVGGFSDNNHLYEGAFQTQEG